MLLVMLAAVFWIAGAQAVHDDGCGTTNSANTPSPWPFTPKVPVGTNIFPVGHFFEGGIDLAALDLGGACFSSFLAETRTSNTRTRPRAAAARP